MEGEKLKKLRLVITENLRVQRGGVAPVPYIDTLSALGDVCARQNHAIFARRGCGKTLLLHHSTTQLPEKIRAVYLNCEDFKHHSFPNVLIEILDAVFAELEANLKGWFGRQKVSRELMVKLRATLATLKVSPDERERSVKESHSHEVGTTNNLSAELKKGPLQLGAALGETTQTKAAIEQEYVDHDSKLAKLNLLLPSLKKHIREFFAASGKVEAVFIQVDDFYHLR